MDSDGLYHITGNDSVFSELIKHDKERVIVIVDDIAHPMEKEGVVKVGDEFTSSILLNDVYHVLGLKKNLVSIYNITDTRKCVLFEPKDVKVLDNAKNIEPEFVLANQNNCS